MNRVRERREGEDVLFPRGHARVSGTALGQVKCECGKQFGSHVAYNIHTSEVIRERRRGRDPKITGDEESGEEGDAGTRGGNGRASMSE